MLWSGRALPGLRIEPGSLLQSAIIVRSGILSETIQSIEYRKIRTLTLTEKSDGSGTIQFGEASAVSAGEGITSSAMKIEAVPDARSAYNIIRKASQRLI
jgi:hypothetical protein